MLKTYDSLEIWSANTLENIEGNQRSWSMLIDDLPCFYEGHSPYFPRLDHCIIYTTPKPQLLKLFKTGTRVDSINSYRGNPPILQ